MERRDDLSLRVVAPTPQPAAAPPLAHLTRLLQRRLEPCVLLLQRLQVNAVALLRRLQALALLVVSHPNRPNELQSMQLVQHLMRRNVVGNADRVNHLLLLLQQFSTRHSSIPSPHDRVDFVLDRRVERLDLLLHFVQQLLVVAYVLQRVLRLVVASIQ